MDSNEKKIDLDKYKERIKTEEADVYNIKVDNMMKNRSFNKKRINPKKDMSGENIIFPSEEKFLRIKDNLTQKESKKIDYNSFEEIEDKGKEEEKVINNNENKEKKEEKKGFFGISFGWIKYLYNEVPLLWKKEELVKGYDANGNIVYRPKSKIPLRESNNIHDINKMNAENEANSAGLDYGKKGINYGIYFN